MRHIFYLVGILFIIHELGWLLSPVEKTKGNEKFDKLSTAHKDKKWKEYSEEYKNVMSSKMFGLILFIWLLFGLLTSQWVVFLAILLFNIVIISPISKLTKYSYAYTVVHWLNSIIGLVFGIFVIINSYHLHIDTWQFVKSLFQ